VLRLIGAVLLIACTASGAQNAVPRSYAAEPPQDAGEAPVPEAEPIAAPALTELELSWYDRAAALADRRTIAAAFERRGYTVPSEAYLLIGGISEVDGRPAYTWFSLGDTGFHASPGSFWPASMVKLIAAVGALETLSGHGLTGSATLSFTDGRGGYRGPASRLYGSALTHSNNVAYDRLMKVAGFDALNDRLLNDRDGFPFMTVQRPYDPGSDPTLRISPEIAYSERGLEGVIPRRESERTHEQCPDDGNCATLFELLHFMQRVVLHDELDPRDRFDLHRLDRKAIVRHLAQAPTRIGTAVGEALGHRVTVYNKGGRVPDLVANDHALVVDEETGRRYLVAASIREEGGKDETKGRIGELVRYGVEAVARRMGEGIPVARDGGLPIEMAWVAVEGEPGRVKLNVSCGARATSLALYEGREMIARTDGGPIEVEREVPGGTPAVYLAIARDGERIVGYRALGLVMR